MFSYVAYGLGIHSILPLPELVATEVAADVIVRLGEVKHPLLEVVDGQHRFWATIGEACYCFEGAGTFLVRGGREIIVDPAPGADERTLRLCLLGPALALILYQQGRFILHASAVAVAGNAGVFLGGHGWGKSTLAAALHAQGHDMMTDDVTAIRMESPRPVVLPSFPQFKLWPESIVALGESPEALPLIHPNFVKRSHRVMQGFAVTPLPLRCLYVLAGGPALVIKSLQPQEGLQEVMRHWYGTRFGGQMLQAIGVSSHFRQCVSLVNQVPIRRLQRPPNLSALPDVARLVIEDLANGK